MSSYDEQLNAIRAARAARDEARTQLHQQKLEQLKLLRAQRKAERKEVAADDATLAAIEHLRERIDADLEALRKTQDEHERKRLEAEIKEAQEEITRIAKSAPESKDRTGEINQGRQSIAGQKNILAEREKAVGALLDNFYLELTPQTLIEQWNDETPIMLLPLRLETRFRDIGDGQQQLWVRVFPDDIADRKSTRLNSSHSRKSRMPSSA